MEEIEPKLWDDILSVSEINALINRILGQQSLLSGCWVNGEISNYKHHLPSGHWYFTLKDRQAGIKAVMFRSRAIQVRFRPQNGMQVLVRGDVRIYQRDGSIQLYVDEMRPGGMGDLYLAFEQLKARLAAEGLTDPQRKRPIPAFPARIGIITSPTGAALHDIVRVARRRNPQVELVLIPSAVQGEEAPRELVGAVQRAGRYARCDVLIIGRGGGSLEELQAFNSEEVVRAIAASPIPTISAVGHEVDVTIADFVADLRAPTPSAAAELAVPLAADLRNYLRQTQDRLAQSVRERLRYGRRELDLCARRPCLADPRWWIQQRQQQLTDLEESLQQRNTGFMMKKNDILSILSAKLDALSPLAVLGRGYSLAHRADGRLLNSVDGVRPGDSLGLRLADGALTCTVDAISPERAGGGRNHGQEKEGSRPEL